MPVDFAETTQQEMDDILAVNINGTLKVTHMILPGMVEKCDSSLAKSSPVFSDSP
jgi:17beta-estradiol 17-dehydrogenase / very-long-chain 3-oxoacyl-CoA reductase